MTLNCYAQLKLKPANKREKKNVPLKKHISNETNYTLSFRANYALLPKQAGLLLFFLNF